MSDDPMQFLKLDVTHIHGALADIKTDVGEFARDVGTRLDRLDNSLERIEQRLRLLKPTGPDPFAIR